MLSPEDIFSLKNKIAREKPLIHCIASHVTANCCANAVLALGGKPVMAEYAEECAEITSAAKALSLNLGGISESKLAAMERSAYTAREKDIPFILDAVGAGCSGVRLRFALDITEKYSPNVIKGNASEIAALCGIETRAKGVESDTDTDMRRLSEAARAFAEKTGAVVMITGKTDAVTDGRLVCAVHGGSSLMTLVTGMGCVSGVTAGCFLAAADPFESAVSAAVVMKLAGEYAQIAFERSRSISRFRDGITDGLFIMDKDFFIKNARYELYE